MPCYLPCARRACRCAGTQVNANTKKIAKQGGTEQAAKMLRHLAYTLGACRCTCSQANANKAFLLIWGGTEQAMKMLCCLACAHGECRCTCTSVPRVRHNTPHHAMSMQHRAASKLRAGTASRADGRRQLHGRASRVDHRRQHLPKMGTLTWAPS